MQFSKSFATFEFDAIVFRTLECQNSRIFHVFLAINSLILPLRFDTNFFLKKLRESNAFTTTTSCESWKSTLNCDHAQRFSVKSTLY